jgi:hypothetical protein
MLASLMRSLLPGASLRLLGSSVPRALVISMLLWKLSILWELSIDNLDKELGLSQEVETFFST